MKELPKDSIQINFENNTYIVKFPTTGQLIDIEVLKSRLSKGQYINLLSGTNDSLYSTALIDAISTFTVLIPDLEKDINFKSILDIPLTKMKLILQQYIEIYKPWYMNWMDIITSPIEEEKDNG